MVLLWARVCVCESLLACVSRGHLYMRVLVPCSLRVATSACVSPLHPAELWVCACLCNTPLGCANPPWSPLTGPLVPTELEELRRLLPEMVRFEPTWEELELYKDGGVAIVDQWICAHAR